MIYLITGSPGTGKTSLAVSMILKNYDGLFTMTANDGTVVNRPLYFCHIDGLDAKKFKAHELTEEQIMSAPLRDIVPTGSVVIVDEADYTYPVRSSTREVPPYIKTLKELRHEGFTLIVMTQHPTMLDAYLRNLVGKHLHLERKQVGTKLYEFLRCETSFTPQVLGSVVSKFYKPDKRAFKYYKSASVHIKFKKKLHWVFFAIPIILVLIVYFMSPFYTKTQEIYNTSQDKEEFVEVVSDGPASGLEQQLSEPAKIPEHTDFYYKPRLPDRPETAPIYDNVRKVAQMEYPVACIDGLNGCNCYSNQGSKVAVSEKACKTYVKDGLPFNPYHVDEPVRAESPRPSGQSQTQTSEVNVLSGKDKYTL